MGYTYNAKTGKVTDTSTGKSTKVSESGGNLSKAIEKLKSDTSSSSKSSSSKKSTSTEGEVSALAKKYGGYDKIPDFEYKKLAEKYNVEEYKSAGAKSTYTGTIGGKVYTGLTEKEILENKINPENPNVKLQSQSTGVREQKVQENLRLEEAKKRYSEGKATTQDIIYLQSQGKTSVDLSTINAQQTKKQLEQYSQAVNQQKQEEPKQFNLNPELSKEQISQLKENRFDISGTQTEQSGIIKQTDYNIPINYIKDKEWTIELVCDYPCNTKSELMKKEDEYIKPNLTDLLCLNEYSATWDKEKDSNRKKRWYEENKERILAKRKEDYNNLKIFSLDSI
jgi:hypothetical protein